MKSSDFARKQHNIVQAATEMHTDHEIQMAREACYNSASNAIELHRLLKNISEQEGLQAWASEKLSLANDYLRSVKEWLEYELMSRTEEHDELDLEAMMEETKKTSTGSVHKAKPGRYGAFNPETDPDADDTSTATQTKKRGRGRPKKDADSDTGEEKKWDFSAFLKPVKLSDPKGKKIGGRVVAKMSDAEKAAAKAEKEQDMTEGRAKKMTRSMKEMSSAGATSAGGFATSPVSAKKRIIKR